MGDGNGAGLDASRHGPWALVLGASDGIGAEFARQVAAAGISVVLVARRAAVLDELAAAIGDAHGVQTRVVPLDLATPGAAATLLAATADLEIGLLVSNAGADDHGCDFLDAPLDEWFALNQRNCVLITELCHSYGTAMRARGRGGMLLVTARSGFAGAARVTIYSATKGYVRNLAEGLWAELTPYGVDVLALVVGATNTPALQKVLAASGVSGPELAEPADVARIGLEHLTDGPVCVPGELLPGAPSPGPDTAGERRTLVTTASNGIRLFFGDR
jgi:short-subunit dehydrogenase